jgi:hypothetical protein
MGTDNIQSLSNAMSHRLEQGRPFRKVFMRCGEPLCARKSRYWSGLLPWNREWILFEGRYHCSPECLERAVAENISKLALPSPPRRKEHRVPLGLVLLSSGAVRHEDLQAALKAQRESGHGLVGEWLRQYCGVSEQQIAAALGMQWSRPVYPLARRRSFLKLKDLVPLTILEASQMVIVHFIPTSRLLYAAFAQAIDHTALYTIEQMLQYRIESCIAEQSALDRAIEEIRNQPRHKEFVFDSDFDPLGIARTIRSYAKILNAREVRMVICCKHLWVFLDSDLQPAHLLFRMIPAEMRRGDIHTEQILEPVFQ